MSDDSTEPVARRAQEVSASEISRRICHILTGAADKLGILYDQGFDFEEFPRAIIMAAQADRAKLSPQEYRGIWQIWQTFRRHRLGGDASTPFWP
jgi:hypothetical protein